MNRICDDKYVPSPTDVLRARVRTNGIIETNFRVNDTVIRYVAQLKEQHLVFAVIIFEQRICLH